jgi:TPR repeat protein
MIRLGIFFEKGYGVSKDYGKARKWYAVAADHGNEIARQAVVSIDNRKRK